MEAFAAVACAAFFALAFAGCASRPGEKAMGVDGTDGTDGTDGRERGNRLGLPKLTQRQLEAAAPVVESFAAALSEMAPAYPELAAYRKETAKWRAEDAVGVYYEHNFRDPGARRGILPSDYGEHGFYVRFRCAAAPPPDWPVPTMIVPDLELRGLGVYVWTHVGVSPGPSAGLLERVSGLLDSCAGKLVEIDGKATSNGPSAP